MDAQQARELLIAELKRQGLPPNYIQRLLDELDDHLADLQDERNRHMNSPDHNAPTPTDHKAATVGRAADSIAITEPSPSGSGQGEGAAHVISLHDRLGNPAELAAFAAKQYHNRSFLARHPILTFLLMPLPLTALGATIFILAMTPFGMLSDYLWSGRELDHPLLFGTMLSVIFWASIVFPPLLAALFCCRIARRNTLSWRWSLIACVLISSYCACLSVFYNNASVIKNNVNGFVCVGIGFNTNPLWMLYYFLPKFALAMAIGLLLIKRAQCLQKLDELRVEKLTVRRAA